MVAAYQRSRSLKKNMGDFLDLLAITARENIKGGYYYKNCADLLGKLREKRSLRDAIFECERAAIIAEIKFSSPSARILRNGKDVETLSRDMVQAGAVGISVLTEPKYFSGSLKDLFRVRMSVDAPLLMKDIVLSKCQIDAAYKIGVNAILLIVALFERGYCDMNLHEMIEYAHNKGLEVLLETHNVDEFRIALSTEADMIGINNRDLRTLNVDIKTTRKVLERFRRDEIGDRPIVSESGIKSPNEIRFLRKFGVDAFLVGSAIMTAKDVRDFVSKLVNAYEKS